MLAVHLYGACAHAFAACAHTGRSRALYAFAHAFMGAAIVVSAFGAFRGHALTSVVGTIGHISIIVYMLNNYDLRKHAIVALGILGHLAMQGVHWIEHYERRHSRTDRRFKYVRLAAFSALLVFYLNYAASNRAEAVGRYLLAGLYLTLLLEQALPISNPKSI